MKHTEEMVSGTQFWLKLLKDNNSNSTLKKCLINVSLVGPKVESHCKLKILIKLERCPLGNVELKKLLEKINKINDVYITKKITLDSV